MKKLTTLTFIVFALAFLVSRLIVFPFVIVRSTLVETRAIIVDVPFYWETNICLIVLLGLHLNWFYLILVMAYGMLVKRSDTVEDVRSDSEGEEDEDTLDDSNLHNRKQKEKIKVKKEIKVPAKKGSQHQTNNNTH